MRYVFILAALFGLSACAAQFNQELAKAKTECRQNSERPTEFANCYNEKYSSIHNQYMYPYPDLVNLANANRLALAQKVEKRKISETDAELEQAALESRLWSEMEQRVASQKMSSGAHMQGTGSLMQGLGTMQQANQPRQPIVCNRMGNSTFCN
jgi:hypothetical protein